MAGRKGSKNGHLKGEELLRYKSMKEWFESLKYCAISRGKKGLTKETKKHRLSIMANFVKWSKMNPDQLLEEAQRDINLTGKRLIDYFENRMKKLTITFVLLLILSFMLVSIPEIGVVKAQGTIYIRADGSVEGTVNSEK